MEIVFAVIGVVLVGYLFWQSYLLSQYKKIVDNQKDVIVKLSRTIDTLKPFQVLIATLRGGNSPHAQKPNVSGLVYNSIIKKGKTMQMIYLVINDEGYLEMMYDNEQSAKDYIALKGNENYTIDSEEMC